MEAGDGRAHLELCESEWEGLAGAAAFFALGAAAFFLPPPRGFLGASSWSLDEELESSLSFSFFSLKVCAALAAALRFGRASDIRDTGKRCNG